MLIIDQHTFIEVYILVPFILFAIMFLLLMCLSGCHLYLRGDGQEQTDRKEKKKECKVIEKRQKQPSIIDKIDKILWLILYNERI